MERIPVTHAGSLIRPAELLSFLSAIDQGKAFDSADYRAALAVAVADVVARQVETGLDVVDDGEMGKSSWITYLYERTTGLESRPVAGGFASIMPASRDRQHFPGAYAELDSLEERAARASTGLGAGGDEGRPGAADPEHGAGGASEWALWEGITLPADKVLVPGVVTHHTNVVEHPELVAQRLVRLANVVGRDRVMGGTDCGFAQGAFVHRVHEEIQWAKLASLVAGARIASRELWGVKADV
jgi:methionine synthase II (cobalamin-independent)